jgi:ribosomal-protein-alanine N-acetyltransferase
VFSEHNDIYVEVDDLGIIGYIRLGKLHGILFLDSIGILRLIENPDQISILPANWRDMNALRQLERVCFPLDAWPLLDIIGVLSFPNVIRLKAVAADRMVGFIAGDKRSGKEIAWISTLCVLPSYRRKGIASALLEDCEAQLEVPRIRLSVRVTNNAALQLYERSGYTRVGLWPKYYRDSVDAVVLEKHHRNRL